MARHEDPRRSRLDRSCGHGVGAVAGPRVRVCLRQSPGCAGIKQPLSVPHRGRPRRRSTRVRARLPGQLMSPSPGGPPDGAANRDRPSHSLDASRGSPRPRRAWNHTAGRSGSARVGSRVARPPCSSIPLHDPPRL